MDDRMKELERIQNELLTQDQKKANSVDDILNDEELNALLQEMPAPAFDDPEKIHAPKGDMVYNNYANDYGSDEEEETETDPQEQDDRAVVRMLIGACLLCLGLIAVMGYWLAVLP